MSTQSQASNEVIGANNNNGVDGDIEYHANTSTWRKMRKNICNQCKEGNCDNCSAHRQAIQEIRGYLNGHADYLIGDSRPVCVCVCYGVDPALIKDGKSSYNRQVDNGDRRRAVNDLRNPQTDRQRHPKQKMAKLSLNKGKSKRSDSKRGKAA